MITSSVLTCDLPPFFKKTNGQIKEMIKSYLRKKIECDIDIDIEICGVDPFQIYFKYHDNVNTQIKNKYDFKY
jgi:hypothetical protein